VILAADWVVPVDGPPVRDGAVEVRDGVVAAVGERDGREDELLGGCLILPGLVNAHTHLEYAGMAGFGDGLAFEPWIADHIRRKNALSPDDLLEQARAGAAACVGAGTTAIADCCYAGTVGRAALAAGLRAIVYVEAFSAWPDLRARTAERLEALDVGEHVTAGVSPHAPATVTHEDYAMLVGLARERGLPVATHMLESAREREHLDAFAGVLGPDTVVVHGVQANAEDIALMAAADIPLVHCPRSNALLGCGIAPLRELLDAGVRVGLGTDSPSSALDFDMWAEMRAAVMHARARSTRADALTPREALELATAGGARTLGLPAGVGTLAPGAPADLVVLDLAGSGFLPWDDPVAAAVYGGSSDRVLLTMIQGEIRYRRGTSAPPPPGAARAKMLLA
jgi:5-methylthioadenosine/S-adenosylhomocysteine deaminase